MPIVSWLVLGLIAGFIGSKIVNRGGNLVGDVIVGMIGAFVGGYLFRLFGMRGVSGLNLWSIGVAIVGSVVLLTVYYALRRR